MDKHKCKQLTMAMTNDKLDYISIISILSAAAAAVLDEKFGLLRPFRSDFVYVMQVVRNVQNILINSKGFAHSCKLYKRHKKSVSFS